MIQNTLRFDNWDLYEGALKAANDLSRQCPDRPVNLEVTGWSEDESGNPDRTKPVYTDLQIDPSRVIQFLDRLDALQREAQKLDQFRKLLGEGGIRLPNPNPQTHMFPLPDLIRELSRREW